MKFARMTDSGLSEYNLGTEIKDGRLKCQKLKIQINVTQLGTYWSIPMEAI